MHSFAELCRRYGLKITPQRTALYRIVHKAKSHPSAKDVYEEIIREYPNISIDTVNRTLNTFAEYGFIDVVEGYGEPKRFDPDMDAHHHLHCIVCGKIIDLPHDKDCEITIPESLMKDFSVISKRIVINGICGDCQVSRK